MGEEELLKSRGVEVVVCENESCKQLMKDFISNSPSLWNEDIGEQDNDQEGKDDD